MKNSCNKQLSYIPHWNVVSIVSFIVFNSVCFPEHRLINYFIVFILVQMYRYSIVLCHVIIKKHIKSPSITIQRFLLLTCGVIATCSVQQDHHQLIHLSRITNHPNIMSQQSKVFLSDAVCLYAYSQSHCFVSECVLEFSVCVSKVICTLEFCSLWLTPISSTASSFS